MYRIEFSKAADRALRKMPTNMAKRIRDKLLHLANDPMSTTQDVKKLVGRPGYRLRVGNWRVIYEIYHGKLVIVILTVAPRGGVYQ